MAHRKQEGQSSTEKKTDDAERKDNPASINWSYYRNQLEMANIFLSIITKISFFGGLTILVIYSVTEKFSFPLQTTAQVMSTAVIWMVLSIWFLFLLGGVFLAYFSFKMIGLLLKKCIRKWDKNIILPEGWWILTPIGLLMNAIILIGFFIDMSFESFIRLMATYAVGGFLFMLYRHPDKIDWQSVMMFGIIMPIGLFSMSGIGWNLTTRTMEHLGIRSKAEDLVIVSSKAHDTIMTFDKVGAMGIKSCPFGDNRWLLPDAIVLWRGLGGPASLKLTGVKNNKNDKRDETPYLTLDFAQDSVDILHPQVFRLDKSHFCKS